MELRGSAGIWDPAGSQHVLHRRAVAKGVLYVDVRGR